MRRLLAIGWLAALGAAPAAAQGKPAERLLVYVDDVTAADKSLASDATALTSALCAALGKERRLDVMCAPDIRQIMGFAATAAMVGTSNGSSNAVTERLDKTQLVVSAALRKDGAALVLVVKAGSKAADASADALYVDRVVVALEQRADAPKKLHDALPALGAKVAEGLLKPAAPAAPTPPPAPLDGTAPKRG